MLLNNLIIVLLSTTAMYAFNPFKPVPLSMNEQMTLSIPEDFSDTDLTTMLESTARNSEVYTKALISLQNLQGESSCHRLAVQLLMNNCKDTTEMSDHGLPFMHDAHKNQVEGFITGLTLCVLARGEFVIPASCSPFTASALLRAHKQGKRSLDVSKEQNDCCVAALSRDSSQWATWLFQQKEAMTICLAVRPDIEKDETISLHKELTRVMAEFAGGLDADRERLEQDREREIRARDSQSEIAWSQMKNKFQDNLDVANNGFQDVFDSINSTNRSIVDMGQMLKVFLKTVVQSNADVAASQDMVVAATTNLAASRMDGINSLAGDTSVTLNQLRSAIDELTSVVFALGERQNVIGLKAQNHYVALDNMTTRLYEQAKTIEQASFIAKDLSSQLKEGAVAAKSWFGVYGIKGTIIIVGQGFALAILPYAGVRTIGWGLPPSMKRNIGIGGSIALAIIVLPWLLKLCNSEWTFRSQPLSILLQLARRND